ncbi:MAG: ATP-binding protein [Thermodesulfobacteriota bacterium]
MRRSRPKTLFLPVLGLLAAVLVLLTVVTVTTYVNMDRGGRQARRVLDAQATAIVSGLAAGIRTGWRHWVWRPESLQGLVQEMSGGDVAFIVLLDKQGQVLAHSNPEFVGRSSARTRAAVARLDMEEIRGWFTENGFIYLAGRRLRPDEFPRPAPHGMGMGMMRPDHLERLEALRPDVILVGLQTKTFREARRREVQHALIMGALLFVLGSGAIYFIFVVQNYRTVDRTLTELSTYTAGIVDNMPNGLITLDASGEPVMVNRAAREMFGWGDAAENTLSDRPVIRALSAEFVPILARGRDVLEREFTAEDARGRPLPLAISAAAVSAENVEETRPGAIFILRDLSQIKALEERVRQSERLAAVGRLAAGVAHEVRNPLSSMRGLARFLARGLDEKSREAEYLKVMVEEIDRLNRVITGLLDFARPRPPEPAPVDLNDAARHTLNLVRDDARHNGIALREDLDPVASVIKADRDQAIQAMLNVLLNAIEAMPQGGRLTVTTKQGDGLALFVAEDTGPGFPPEDRDKLVDPFFTTKKKGTGLGLAQVARIMEAHGGRLELGGEPGRGARVALSFPLNPGGKEES